MGNTCSCANAEPIKKEIDFAMRRALKNFQGIQDLDGNLIITLKKPVFNWISFYYEEELYSGEQIDPNQVYKEQLQMHFGQALKDVRVFFRDADFNKKLDKLAIAQIQANTLIMKNEFYARKKSNESPSPKVQKSIQNMERINDMNWQYHLLQYHEGETRLDDYDSMIIGHQMHLIQKDPKVSKRIVMPIYNLTVNFYSSLVVNKRGLHRVLLRAYSNDREERTRPRSVTHKVFATEFKINPKFGGDKLSLSRDYVTYGQKWSKECNNDFVGKQLPSFDEIMEGIYNWYTLQIQRQMQGKSAQQIYQVTKSHKLVFDELYRASGIKNTSKPLLRNHNDELGLLNPRSLISCFILYLHSIEFGDPPLYADLNRVIRETDNSQLRNLGPYSKALDTITTADVSGDDTDAFKTGKQLQGQINSIAGSFLLWRGAQLREEEVQKYEQSVYSNEKEQGISRFIFSTGNASCSLDLNVALNFTYMYPEPDHLPVIFVISCQNYFKPEGLPMNIESCTSYPSEGEYLLREGSKFYVLDIEREVEIDNPFTSYSDFNGFVITIIHLFHTHVPLKM